MVYCKGSLFGLLDKSNYRSSHDGVIPKGGGIGILAAFVISSIFLKISPTFLIPAVILSLISLIGDRKEISPKLRLPVQFIAAFFFLLQASDHFPLISDFWLLTSVFFSLFIIATTNWYNFMDGINGIAGITAVVGFGLLACYNYNSQGDSRLTVLSICIICACLGFLPFNFPKARVFMGDVGSILLGFVFASIVVMLSKSFLDFVCLSAFLFPFYADEFVTMAVRLKDGENLLHAHRRHFYQLLANEMGIAHWKVTLGYGLLQLIVGISVLLVKPFGVLSVIIVLSVFFAGFIFANYKVRMRIGNRK
ncbi:MAG: glycosyltransferase family 4 protein [Bacteroidales bacterium]|nr:glycosyltransferase family 4 protein [Bacteroidales bacterium]